MAISPTGNNIILGQIDGSVTVLHCKKDQVVQGYSMDIEVRYIGRHRRNILDLERHYKEKKGEKVILEILRNREIMLLDFCLALCNGSLLEIGIRVGNCY